MVLVVLYYRVVAAAVHDLPYMPRDGLDVLALFARVSENGKLTS